MNEKKFRILKPILYVLTNAAFLLIVANVNVTCCGPGYQPELPTDFDKLKCFKDE